METVFYILGNVIYAFMFLIALWGAYNVFMVFIRVKQKQFDREDHQTEFLEAIEEPLARGEYESAIDVCDGDRRAVCQLSLIHI